MILNRCASLLVFVCDPTGSVCWASRAVPEYVARALHSATLTTTPVTLYGFTALRLPDGSMAGFSAEALTLAAEVTRDAYSDFLTGLPNRRMFDTQLNLLWVQSQRNHLPFAVYFIDVDGLKAINDKHGHAAGDALIKAAAITLSGCVREADSIARLSGDEFAVIAPGIPDIGAASILLDRMVRALDAIQAPYPDAEIRASASVGLALSSEAESPSDLLAQADRAMYLFKQHRKTKADNPAC